MSNALEIGGKTLHPIKEAAQLVSYSRDYVTRLAREEKIIAQLVGRQWFVDVESLRQYAEATAIEQELRKKQLSEERKRERLAREAAEEKNTLRIEQSSGMHSRAVSVAALVLCLGLVMGWGTFSLIGTSASVTPTANVAQVNEAAPVAEDRIAPAKVAPAPTAESDDSVIIPDFSSKRVDPLGETDNGVLLLPSADTATVTELFSDEVMVIELLNGEQAVVRVNQDGEPVGNEIPYVVVPVEEQ